MHTYIFTYICTHIHRCLDWFLKPRLLPHTRVATAERVAHAYQFQSPRYSLEFGTDIDHKFSVKISYSVYHKLR